MDGPPPIKVEETNFEDSWSGDAAASSSASDWNPLKIETTTDKIPKIKSEKSHEEEPLLNHEKTTSQQQSPTVTVQELSEYRCEVCIADGKKLQLYANKGSLSRHMRYAHSSTPRFNCQVCSKHFNTPSSFKRHSCLHLNQSSRVQDAIKYRCELCIADGKKLKLYANKKALRAHMRVVHRSTPRFKCELCFKPFNTLAHFKTHSQVHLNQTLSFKCELCFEKFTTKANLNLHLVQNHNHSSEGLNLFQCKLCISEGQKLKYFATKERLLAHMRKAHRSAPRFKCEVCFKQFNCGYNFKKHSLAHLNQTVSFNCEVCSLAWTSKASLHVHLVRVHNYNSKKLNVKVFPCDLCSHTFFRKSALERHVVKTHVVDKPLECHVCSKTFIDQNELSKHLKGHDKQPCHNCDVCSKAFTQKRSLLRHLGVEHHHFFYCDKCKKSFSNKSEFDAHLKLLSQNEFSCQVCSQFFRSQCSLSLHIECHNLTELQNQGLDSKGKQIKNNSGEFKCEICLKSFDREAYIVAHRTLVHPNSQWPCSKCSKTFKTRSHMKLHELTHQEVKPHACKFCDRSYRRARELKIHENNAHSSTKHFKCQQCPESFANPVSLKVHMGNFHGVEKPFKCHLCSTSWVAECYLKSHLISHRTEKLFPCESCTKSFKDLKSLKQHVRIVHFRHAASKRRKVSRYSESLVFVCSLCSFETQEDKEVAAHYNSHGLPKITLFRDPLTSATLTHNSPQTAHLNGNVKLVRCIEDRFKCSTSSKPFNSPNCLRMHSYSHSKPKLKKSVRYATLRSVEASI